MVFAGLAAILLATAAALSTAFAAPLSPSLGSPAVAPRSGSATTSGGSFAGSSPSWAWIDGRGHQVAAILALAAASALIVQNKGGGHGEIGYHLALTLAKEKGLKVTMIGDSAAKTDKPPFNSYADLEAAGVTIQWADLAAGGITGALASVAPCDFVFDNQNVCPTDVQKAVAAWNPKAYAYVSSGGMYKPVAEGPLLEVGEVKEDNKQLGIERSAQAAGLAWSAFRPQYIYGPKTNKRDYIDWFLDRIVRDLPVPLPADGSLTTTLTNAQDVASMMARVVDKPSEAKGKVFNCASDVRISHLELVELIAKTVGKDPEAVKRTVKFYDPAQFKGVDLPKKGKFPFRETHFGVGVGWAKVILDWAPKCNLEDDLKWYFEEYKRLGKDQGDVGRDWDAAILGSAAAAPSSSGMAGMPASSAGKQRSYPVLGIDI